MLTISSSRRSVLSLLNGNRSPYIAFPFIADGNVSYTVQRQNPETVQFDGSLQVLADSAEGGAGVAKLSYQVPENGVSLKQVGIMRGKKVFSLIVCPYFDNPSSKTLTYFDAVNVTLTSDKPFPQDFDKPSAAILSRLTNKVASTQPKPTGSFNRILVNREGIYHITGYDLDTSGVDISGFTSQNLTLWNHGKQIPIFVYTPGGTQFTADSYIEFYGTQNLVNYSGGRPDLYLDPFSENNVYFLTKDSTVSAERLITESGALNTANSPTDLSGYSFTKTVHLEQDKKFERLDQADLDQPYDRRDHWFWAEVSSNQMITVPFTLSYPDTTSVQPLFFTAAFHGITHLDGTNGSPNVPNEHQAELFINQTHVLSSTWDDQNLDITRVGPDANIPQSVLHNGANNFQVYDANQGNIAVATFAFNWVEMSYQRLYVADQDYIRFTVPDNAQPGYYKFLIQNFRSSSISVYRLNESKITDVTIEQLNSSRSKQGYAALFQSYVQSTQNEFIAVSDSGKLKPAGIEEIPDPGLSSYDYSADYIMVVNESLDDITKAVDPNNPVSQLASWYNDHGTKTLVVDVDEVYDDFSYGIKSPYGIKSFLSYAYHNWSSAPKYVLFVGKGSWNTKNGGDSTNLIPVMLYQTYTFGATSADNFYACVDGDDPIPDIAVGRIPAVTADQLKFTVAKILGYYSNEKFGWQNSALLIAGEENEFHIQTDSIVHTMIPPNFFINRLYTSIQDPEVDTKYYGTTTNLLSYIGQGTALVNFMGHGGGAIWADNGILTNDQVANISNKGKYPFVTSMTCFTGAFDGQEGYPLSSTLLFAQDKGAVGVLASAGLGWMYNDFFMDGELIPLIFDSPSFNSSVGYDLLSAKAQYYASYYYWPQAVTMVNQYNLIGDPAFVIQLPQNNSAVKLSSYTLSAGQNDTVSVSGGPVGGAGTIQLTNDAGDVLAQNNITLSGSGSGTSYVSLPGNIAGVGHVKAYLYNASTQSSSSVDFSSGGSFAEVSGFTITESGGLFHILISAHASSTPAITSLSFVGQVYSPPLSGGGKLVGSLSILLSPSLNEYSGIGNLGSDSLKPGDVITGNLKAILADGTVLSSPQVSYTTPGAADLSAFSSQGYANVNSSIKVVADSSMRLQAEIYDLNKVAIKNVRVDFYDGQRGQGTFLGNTRVSFDTATQELATVSTILSPGNHIIYVYLVLDSLTEGFDLHPEKDYAYNNIQINFVVANSAEVVTVDSSAMLEGAPVGGIFLAQRTTVSLYNQPLIMTAKEKNNATQFYEFASMSGTQPQSYSLSVSIYNPDSTTKANLAALHLYEFDSRTRTLNIVAGSAYSNEKVTGTVSGLGIFTAAYSTDQTPPQVTISVGDQFFTDGDFVPPDPRFSFLLHDEDGINLSRKNLDIELDNTPVNNSAIVLPDTVTDPTSVTAAVQLPTQANGQHTIRITAEDANGNTKTDSVRFTVKSDFSLRVYGCYPNPFVNQTFIAFVVTSGNPIDGVQIKIYTVSGRLVKTIRYPSNNPEETVGLLQGGTGLPIAVGYHEAWWDGTDTYGNQVANGIYFYKVSVSSGGKTVEDIGKMARLR